MQVNGCKEKMVKEKNVDMEENIAKDIGERKHKVFIVTLLTCLS